VSILGIAFMFLPQSIQVQLPPEQETLWEDEIRGSVYRFEPGELSIVDGVSSYVKVWSEESITLNTTFYLIFGELNESVNIIDNPTKHSLPGEGAWSIQITGNIVEETEALIYASTYYLIFPEPTRITFYPYRYFGYGMTMIGVMASLAIYAGSIKKIKKSKQN
jgi:hypothetical protein